MALQYGRRSLGQPDEVDPDLLTAIELELEAGAEVSDQIAAAGEIPPAVIEQWIQDDADPIEALAGLGYSRDEAGAVVLDTLAAQRGRISTLRTWLVVVSALLGVSIIGLIALVSRSKN